ncbi:MAG TPA: NAD(P)H-dependent glycerol-3-phosphate dehydrogenase, partial [Actinomycetota bacterium]|nr:NAD(P)H-dependent glycerol-3-phosphate dehydrogenase [Actinomycetota bacterium]
VTVFGAGAMGTAIAMHLARNGNDTCLWGSQWDERVLPDLLEKRRHPGLPEFLPEALTVLGPNDLEAAAKGMEIAVMGAHSGGARTLSRLVREGFGDMPVVVGLAKGLEPDTGKRMSEVYAEEVGHDRVVAMGGPCLAPEVAQGLPSAAVMAATDQEAVERCADAFRGQTFRVQVTDDVPGLEYCTVAKNVSAMAMGILDGMGKTGAADYRNAKAALFTRAIHELTEFVQALGGRADTALGLAGLGDTLVTSLGGRNRLYGELIGEGAEPEGALEDLTRRGMTVEGVESARDIERLIREHDLDLPVHATVFRILFEGTPPTALLESVTAG